MTADNERMGYDMAAVTRRVGCHAITIRRMIAAGQFPKPFYIGNGSAPRWRAEDVEDWIAGGGVKREAAEDGPAVVRGGRRVQVRGQLFTGA